MDVGAVVAEVVDGDVVLIVGWVIVVVDEGGFVVTVVDVIGDVVVVGVDVVVLVGSVVVDVSSHSPR